MKEQLLEFLNNRISECDSSASELFLERDNSRDGDKLLAMAGAFREIIEFLKSTTECTTSNLTN